MKKILPILLILQILAQATDFAQSSASKASACASVSHLITLKDVKKTFDTREKISIVNKFDMSSLELDKKNHLGGGLCIYLKIDSLSKEHYEKLKELVKLPEIF